ncbi:MAG: Error-prone repair protein ImuA [Sediminibacterium sp.]
MFLTKAATVSHLRKEILIREGLKKNAAAIPVDLGLGSINQSFPDGCFPLTSVHEFCCSSIEDKTATTGFIAGLLSTLMKSTGVVLWITPTRNLFPPAFYAFGIDPARIIFIDLPREKDMLWMMDEALKCNGLTAVVGEIHQLDFTASRRLQLAVEESKVTGFVIRQITNLNTTACVSRWRVTGLPSRSPGGLPGIGFPHWNVELLKIRNGKPGCWQLEWSDNRFKEITKEIPQHELQREAI